MDLELNDDQKIIGDSLQRFIKESYDYPARRALSATAAGFSPAHWQFFADMGLLALPLPEQHGGLDADFSYTALVMEWFGRGLVAEPYLATVIQAGGILRRIAPSALQAVCLQALGEGKTIFAFAGEEASGTHARSEDGGYVLDGVKRLVAHGPSAAQLIVSAELDGEPALLLVAAGQPGVTIDAYRTIDSLPACDAMLCGVRVEADHVLARGGSVAEILQEVASETLAAMCAEACGCMDALFDMTLDYVQQRKQFGRTIGSFQAIQHRLADAYTELELVRSMALVAARGVSSGAPGRHRDIAAAMAFIGEAGQRMGHTAIQLHGAMGMTQELAVGGYHRRLLAIAAQAGGARRQVDRFIKLQEK